VKEAIGNTSLVPEKLDALMNKNKTASLISPEYAIFKSTLLNILKKL